MSEGKTTRTDDESTLAAMVRELDAKLTDALAAKERAEAARDALVHERDTVQSEIKARYAVEQRDVWYWHGDGSDHHESLANECHVVMTGAQIREILAERDVLAAKLAEAERDAGRLKKEIEECRQNR